jgi:hypothetical protein
MEGDFALYGHLREVDHAERVGNAQNFQQAKKLADKTGLSRYDAFWILAPDGERTWYGEVTSDRLTWHRHDAPGYQEMPTGTLGLFGRLPRERGPEGIYLLECDSVEEGKGWAESPHSSWSEDIDAYWVAKDEHLLAFGVVRRGEQIHWLPPAELRAVALPTVTEWIDEDFYRDELREEKEERRRLAEQQHEDERIRWNEGWDGDA